MKAGENIKWFRKGEEVPNGARLISIVPQDSYNGAQFGYEVSRINGGDMKNLMKVNLNEYILFKIEQKGLDIWRDHYADCVVPYNIPEADSLGFHKLQLWVFMSIFGPYMGNGFDNPVQMNVLIKHD